MKRSARMICSCWAQTVILTMNFAVWSHLLVSKPCSVATLPSRCFKMCTIEWIWLRNWETIVAYLSTYTCKPCQAYTSLYFYALLVSSIQKLKRKRILLSTLTKGVAPLLTSRKVCPSSVYSPSAEKWSHCASALNLYSCANAQKGLASVCENKCITLEVWESCCMGIPQKKSPLVLHF